ncbi:MAG: hypothetical protein SOX83_09205 [Sodaliphilus sp.]|nr:hypothetical protein [Sodaliphilus sp.]
MKKIYVSILAAALVAIPTLAQENLQKEITLPKDFVPVVKKPVKKSSLPRVLKPVRSDEGKVIGFTDWAEPTAVSVEIPTMLPYGYRTAHRFSNRRGYFDAGAGSQLNFVGSAGYRLVDDASLKVDAWAQHNSTWNGKNSSPVSEPEKQQFCDNAFGVDLMKDFSKGQLDVAAKVHFDKFNYYGHTYVTGPQSNLWWDNKQNFFETNVKAAWAGTVDVSRYHNISYKVGMNYNYAGYKYGIYIGSPSVVDGFDGAKEHHLQAWLGASYAIEASSSIGADFKFQYLNRSYCDLEAYNVPKTVKRNSSMLTIAPFYTYNGQNWVARLGVNVDLSFNDGTKFRLAPNVQLSYEFTPGVTFFANAVGGKQLNTISRVNALSRYIDPNGFYGSTFVPFDGEAGLKVGPFSGLTVKLYAGYGMAKDALIPFDYSASAMLKNWDFKGLKAGATLNYQYRSLAELNLGVVFAPQSSNLTLNDGEAYSGYMLGLDHAKLVANADVQLHLTKALTVGVGFDLRNGRRYMEQVLSISPEESDSYFALQEMNDVMNLHAGASYRFDKFLTIWVKAANLLNKQWDIFPYMGAQKLNVMGGIGLVF